MREIKYIVIHCTATIPSAKVSNIKKYWKEKRGWENPGYHYLITNSSIVYHLLPINEIANGAFGYNHNSIHIGYVGGIDSNGAPKDTRTIGVKHLMMDLIRKARARFPDAVVLGHRDLPDVQKNCPCFDVMTWMENYESTYL